MNSLFKPLLVSTLVASAGLAAYAQGTGAPTPVAPHMHRQMDPAKMQEMMAKRQAELKAKLNISAAQESAWSAYVAAMQPPADMGQRMSPESRKQMHDEWAALTTPQRIDKMNEMKARRDAEMAKRGDATKALYAALTPAQQKVFDTSAMRHGPGGPHDGPGRHMKG